MDLRAALKRSADGVITILVIDNNPMDSRLIRRVNQIAQDSLLTLNLNWAGASASTTRHKSSAVTQFLVNSTCTSIGSEK
jgi:hypothetical protein